MLETPEDGRFDAAVVLADVSGFTSLAERLAAKGPGGGARLLAVPGAPVPRQLPEPDPLAEAEAALCQYLPGSIRSRVEAGQSQWLSDLRQVTVIFANLPDLDHDTPIEQAHEAMRALQTALYKYEGSINKLSVDEKGVSLVAATGLPPLSHEDDPARGVLAALAMQRTLQDLDLRGSIGLATRTSRQGVGRARRWGWGSDSVGTSSFIEASTKPW